MPPLPAACAALLVLLASLSAAAASPAVPLEVYGRLPALDKVCLSPDGTRIAFVRAVDEERAIAVRSLLDRKLLGVERIQGQKIRKVEWIDDNRLMIVTSTTENDGGTRFEWLKLRVYNVFRNTSIPILGFIGGRVVARRVNGRVVLFFPSGFSKDGYVHHLLRGIDVDTGEAIVSSDREDDSLDWLIDANGRVVAEQFYSEKKHQWSIWIRPEAGWKKIAGGEATIDFPRFLGFGPTADTVLMEVGEQGEGVWKLLALKDGSLGPSLAEGRSLDHPIEDPATNRLIGGSYPEDDLRYVFFDAPMQAHWDAIVQAFKGDHVRFVSASGDLKKVLVLVDGPKFGYQYELVNLYTDKADWVGDVYDGITEALEVRRITYPAGDSLPIPAYLTLPRGREARSLALVVLVHGGPHARDSAHFDWWAQALAEQGYAVLQPNFRGSTINDHFLAAGFGEFGRKMQTDLSDGVRYLAKEGLADPARVCVVGASYGGYAALAGVTLEPGVYRCAVSVAGISDLRKMLKHVNEKHSDEDSREQRFWDRYMGVTGPDDPVLTQISPIRHVESVNAPVLLVHGKDDTVVPYGQSDDMYDALRHARKTVEFVKLKREDHWLSRSETRLQMLQATVAFLRKYNPPD